MRSALRLSSAWWCLGCGWLSSAREVVRGGKLKARKGVNVPDVEIDCAALTEKDIEEPALGHAVALILWLTPLGSNGRMRSTS